MLISDKIPVYLHIPKNAGTYIQDVLINYFIRVTNEPKNLGWDCFIKKISVETPHCNLTVTVRFLTDYWKNDVNMKQHPVSAARGVNNPRARSCEIETLKTYIRNAQLQLLSVVVEPIGLRDLRHGVFLAKDLIELSDKSSINFTTLRECFSRQQSLYYYLTSAHSKHEPSHNCIKERSFLEYLSSESLEDGWLIRVLTNMDSTDTINKHWYQLAIDFLDTNDFIVSDISKTSSTLNDVVSNCFGETIIELDKKETHHNSTPNQNKITIDELDHNTRKLFESRCYWDIKMWKYYCD